MLLTKALKLKNLLPGGVISLTKKVTVPSPSQGKFLLGLIDATHVIAESNEANNLATVVIP